LPRDRQLSERWRVTVAESKQLTEMFGFAQLGPARGRQPDQGQLLYTPDDADRYCGRDGPFDGSCEPHTPAVACRGADQLALACPEVHDWARLRGATEFDPGYMSCRRVSVAYA
jgi:hypothetical protein